MRPFSYVWELSGAAVEKSDLTIMSAQGKVRIRCWAIRKSDHLVTIVPGCLALSWPANRFVSPTQFLQHSYTNRKLKLGKFRQVRAFDTHTGVHY